MNNQSSPFFIKARWRVNFYQKWLYIIYAGLFAWRTFFPLYNPINQLLLDLHLVKLTEPTIPVIGLNVPPTFSPYTIPFGIVSAGEPHQLSFVMIFILGIYMIRPPYYNVDTWKSLIIKLIQSIVGLGFCMMLTEGSWDLVYSYIYNFQAPKLVAGVIGGIALTAEIMTLTYLTRSYKLFNLKRILIVLGILYVYYFIWAIGFGFITSGAPDFSQSLTIAIIEHIHWAIGIGGCAWAYKKQ